MFKSTVVLFSLILITLYTVTAAQTYLEDYCWRDFEGIIPSDAIAAGLDRNGNPIYIGQALYEDKLIPGKIHVNDPNIYFEWVDKEIATNQNIKILCSKHADRFEFIATRSEAVSNLVNKLLIKGGYQEKYSTYIGRTFTDGYTSIGKVICYTDNCLGLYTTNNGVVRVHGVFQILTYSLY